MKPKRLKLAYLPIQQLEHILRSGEMKSCVTIPVAGDLPEGAIVHNVFLDDSRMAFGVVVEHESFDEVGLADEMPLLRDPFSIMLHTVRVINDRIVSPLATDDELKGIRDHITSVLDDRREKKHSSTVSDFRN